MGAHIVCDKCNNLYSPVQGDCPYCEIIKLRFELNKLESICNKYEKYIVKQAIEIAELT